MKHHHNIINSIINNIMEKIGVDSQSQHGYNQNNGFRQKTEDVFVVVKKDM